MEMKSQIITTLRIAHLLPLLFLCKILEYFDFQLPLWHKFHNHVAGETGLLHLQPFTNFLINVESAT
jgi:hypothetical protein